MITGIEKLQNCKKGILQLVNGLDTRYGEITITSGYRTELQNKACGGAKNSLHVTGEAIDIIIKDVSPIKVAAWVLDMYDSVNGIGINVYNGMCHFDIRESKRKVFWSYGRNGKTE